MRLIFSLSVNFLQKREPLPLKFSKEKNEKKRKPFIQVEHFIKLSFLIKILPFSGGDFY